MSAPVVDWLQDGRHGERIALAHGDGTTTHDALRGQVESWSRRVAELPADRPVAVHLAFGPEAVAAWLAVLAAGRPCLTLDPRSPLDQRVARLEHLGAAVLGDATADELPSRRFGATAHTAATVGAALVKYTSGSTSSPKAVLQPAAALACSARTLAAMLALTAHDRHALLSPLALPPSAAQVLATLDAGATLDLLDARDVDPARLAVWVADRRITTLQTVSSLFRVLAGHARGTPAWPALRAVKLGGETVTAQDARLFARTTTAGARLVNGLGLAEAGFNVCWSVWRAGDPLDRPTLPIGAAPDDEDIEVVLQDDDGREPPPGETGRIVVRSPYLPTGYVGAADGTGATYLELPDRPGWRELRTEDLGRRLPDGTLEHAGRRDRVRKIRGLRVDLAEVEAELLATDGVAEAAVVEVDGPRLQAYVVAASGATPTGPAVRRALAGRLAPHAVPALVTVVEALPRLAGGKVDRRALAGEPPAGRSAKAVRGDDPLRLTVRAAFARLLALDDVPTDVSFFELGGDSLAALELVAAVEAVLGVEVPLAELARHPSVDALAALLRTRGWNLTDHPVTVLTPHPHPAAPDVFAWPGAGSDVMSLALLADRLGPAVTFHAVAHRGADGRRVWDLDVATVADRGVGLVRQVQPTGPYLLCGSSFGGVVALEVARRLRAAGEEVALLALLDSYGPGYPVRRTGTPGLAVRHLVRDLRPLGAKDEPGWPVLRRGLRQRRVRLRARRAFRRPRPDAPPLPLEVRYLYLTEACFQASARWQTTLSPYDGRVALFAVERQPPDDLFVADGTLGWQPWVTGGLDVTVVPGHHGGHLKRHHVGALAQALRAAIEAIDSPDARSPAP